MALTVRQLNRATLERQLLLRRARLPIVEAVRRVVALQAQEPVSPYIAMWNRIDRFRPAELDEAFTAREIVKASLMRITLHAVHTDDYTAFHEAMLRNLRASRLNDNRFKVTGLSIAEADALVPPLVELTSQPRTQAEIEELLTQRLGGPPHRGVWWALRTFAPLVHAPTGGTWSFGPRSAFLAAPTTPERVEPSQALPRLLRRYLEGFGPASGADFGQFALQRVPAVREALEALAGELTVLEGPDGAELFDVPSATVPPDDTPAPPRLLPMWDSVLLAHADRSRVIRTEYRKLIFRRNGDVLPTLLVDGFVAGVWRPVDQGIEVTAFGALPEGDWDGIAAEAEGLIALLADREPLAYRRYGRWWSELPRGEVRVLPG